MGEPTGEEQTPERQSLDPPEPQTSEGVRREHGHVVGMRIIKTALAVFLCGIFSWVRREPAFYSMAAVVLCLQNSTGKTIASSINRVTGTLIGGLFGVVLLYLPEASGLLRFELLYYLVIALMILPLIKITLLLQKPDISALTCVVFLSVSVSYTGDNSPALLALHRMADTLAGVAVACAVDLLLPYHRRLEAAP